MFVGDFQQENNNAELGQIESASYENDFGVIFVFFDPIISHSATRLLIIVVRTIPSHTATTLVVVNNLVNLLFNDHDFEFFGLNLG